MEGLRAFANREITKVTFEGVPDRPGIAAEIFGALGRHGINVDLVVSAGGRDGTADISLALAETQDPAVGEALEVIRREVGARAMQRSSGAALVSLLGLGLQTEPGIAGRVFGALSRAGINIEAISTSVSSVTCMIEETRCEAALAALRHEFNLG
jgi:aspartate kinase